MGKGDRRGKVKPTKDMELTEIPKRQPNGQRRTRADSPHDPRKTALQARCRIFGVPATRQNRNALSGQHSGCHLGLVMMATCKASQIPKLWAVWQGLCTAERTYRIRILGMSISAKGAAIAMVPDKMETDQGHTIDTRNSDERDRDAVNTWMAWRGHIGHLSAQEQTLLHQAEQDTCKALWNEGVTSAGRATLAALISLADVVEKK